MGKKGYILLLMMSFMALKGMAQDPQFSQYYAAPLYLNPAFVGTAADHRFITNHRNQWPSLPNAYNFSSFSWDNNIAEYRSGVGLLFTSESAGSLDQKTSMINFNYSYKLNIVDSWVISPALQFGFGSRFIDESKLILGEELEIDRPSYVYDDPYFNNLTKGTFFDVGYGMLIYNEMFWGGASFGHINTPQISLVEGDAKLPIKTSIHAGMKIPFYINPLKEQGMVSLSPSFIYKTQGEFSQLDLGVQIHYNPVMLGLWYRGIPTQHNVGGYPDHDGLNIMLGLSFYRFNVGYSYDLTVSELGTSGGAHEISLMYMPEIVLKKRMKRKEKYIPCPTFSQGKGFSMQQRSGL